MNPLLLSLFILSFTQTARETLQGRNGSRWVSMS